MKKYIYADNAATTKLDDEAFEIMKSYLLECYGNPSQPYFFSMKARRAIKEARATIASCIGALPEEIFFTSGGSESNNWAIKCFGSQSDVRTIFTSEIEHHSILNACKRQGNNSTLIYLPVTFDGYITSAALQNAIMKEKSNRAVVSCETKLVSVMLANNEIGTIQDIKKLAAVSHENGVLFHTDAVQAVGHIKIDVKDLGVDMLSASSHKFNGPKGIGFLYIRKGTLIYSLIDGGQQENGMRAGTENTAAIAAMAVALKNNCAYIEKNTKKLAEIEKAFLSVLDNSKMDYIRNGGENRVPGNISVSFNGFSGEMLLHRLDLMGICVSTGSACDSKQTQISHVLKAIDLPMNYAKGTIRVSFGKYNTVEEAEIIAKLIISIIKNK